MNPPTCLSASGPPASAGHRCGRRPAPRCAPLPSKPPSLKRPSTAPTTAPTSAPTSAPASWLLLLRPLLLALCAALPCPPLAAEPPAGPSAARTPGVASSAPASAAASALPETLSAELRQLVEQAATLAWPVAETAGSAPRIEVEVGRLDPRLRLAPCQRIAPYLPAGTRPLGRSRVGLRCLQGPSAWNVTLPLTVRLLAPSLVAVAALPAGTVIEARHLRLAEVDLVERPSPALAQPELVLGRTLVQGLAAGEALRRSALKARKWFNAGDMVRVVAVGDGFAIGGQAQALDPGIEGQRVRARTENGQVLTGLATASQRLEIAL